MVRSILNKLESTGLISRSDIEMLNEHLPIPLPDSLAEFTFTVEERADRVAEVLHEVGVIMKPTPTFKEEDMIKLCGSTIISILIAGEANLISFEPYLIKSTFINGMDMEVDISKDNISTVLEMLCDEDIVKAKIKAFGLPSFTLGKTKKESLLNIMYTFSENNYKLYSTVTHSLAGVSYGDLVDEQIQFLNMVNHPIIKEYVTTLTALPSHLPENLASRLLGV